MPGPYFTELTNRTLIHISGEETGEFLQGLVTCEVATLKPGQIAFGALLTPQGKILFDFFVIASTNGYIIDVDKSVADDLARRLTFYRLRRKIEIKPMDKRTHIFAVWGNGTDAGKVVADGIVAPDPRLAALGSRAYIRRAPEGAETRPLKDWHAHRVAHSMPEGGLDYAFGDVFPHEALMDQFRGVDFTKGCYVGQEVVSRMQHRGTARKRLIRVTSDKPLPGSGTELLCSGKACGVMAGSDGTTGLAMVRLDRVKGDTPQRMALAGSLPVTLSIPEWCSFDWPK